MVGSDPMVMEAAAQVPNNSRANNTAGTTTDDLMQVLGNDKLSFSELAAAVEALAGKLDRVEELLLEPRDPVDEIRRLAEAGPVTAQELRARGYTALQLMVSKVEGVSDVSSILDGGYKWRDLAHAFPTEAEAAAACEEAHVPLPRLAVIGAPSDLFVKAWVSADSPTKIKDLHDVGVSLPRVVAAGAKPSTLLQAGVKPKALVECGVTGDQLVESGLSAKEAMDAGAAPGSFDIPKGTQLRLMRGCCGVPGSATVLTVEEGDRTNGYKLYYTRGATKGTIQVDADEMKGHHVIYV